MKKLYPVITLSICVLFLTGCGHLSKTVTNFDGVTSGLNPYGSGTVKVRRVSYWAWGDQKSIKKLVDKEIEELPDLPNPPAE